LCVGNDDVGASALGAKIIESFREKSGHKFTAFGDNYSDTGGYSIHIFIFYLALEKPESLSLPCFVIFEMYKGFDTEQ